MPVCYKQITSLSISLSYMCIIVCTKGLVIKYLVSCILLITIGKTIRQRKEETSRLSYVSNYSSAVLIVNNHIQRHGGRDLYHKSFSHEAYNCYSVSNKFYDIACMYRSFQWHSAVHEQRKGRVFSIIK